MAKKKDTTTANQQYAISLIMQRANTRSVKDMNSWKMAMRQAENPENPRRTQLYDLYDQLVIDNHVMGIRDHQLRDRVWADTFKVFNASGNPDEALQDIFEEEWYYDFIDMVIDSLFWGTTMVQIAPTGLNGAMQTQLFPRRHYIPESGLIVRNPSDTSGIAFRQTDLMKYLVEIGKPTDLGVLAQLAPNILFKRNAHVCWSEFAEIFGMPLRIGKTNSRNTTDMNRMEEALVRMGSAAYAVLQDGESVELKETTRTDSYNVYDKLEERCNTEMSKRIVGQTMTTDNGSSRSQGEVHERTLDDVILAIKRRVTYVTNSGLMACLVAQGIVPEGTYLKYDQVLDIDNLWKITEGLLSYYDVEEEWLTETFGVPVTGKRITPGALNAPKKKGLKGSITLSIEQRYESCCHLPDFMPLAVPGQKKARKAFDKFLKNYWDYNGEIAYNPDLAAYQAGLMEDAFVRGWKGKTSRKLALDQFGEVAVEFGRDNEEMIAEMAQNLYRFSSAKSYAMCRELNLLLPAHKTFESFAKAAADLYDNFYEQYLKTEYNLAYITAQNAEMYTRYVAQADTYPTWIYRTAGDSRVRDAHAALDGKAFKADDAVWNTIYPPNGWGCRCYVEPSANTPEKYSTRQEAIEILSSSTDKNGQSELDRMKKGGFAVNRAKERYVFEPGHEYFKAASAEDVAKMSQRLNHI